MSEKNAEKEVEALLLKKKRVEENQYAILRDSNKIHYYTRKNNQWVLDEDLKNKQLKDVFCNIQNKCLPSYQLRIFPIDILLIKSS